MLSGTVNSDTPRAFAALHQAQDDVTTVHLSDLTGAPAAPEVLQLGRYIRSAGLNTHVPNEAQISGGAIDVFAGGVTRTLHDTAVVTLRGRAEVSDVHADYIRYMLGGDGYARFAARFGSDTPRPMTIAELGAMGLINATDPTDWVPGQIIRES